MASLSQRQVLVVDDDPAIRTCMTMLLESAGYYVAVAEDGLEALLLINESAPDILVSDLNMPRLSGFNLLSEMRRRFPQIVSVAMSGAYDSSAVPNGVIAHGCYAKGTPHKNLVGTLAQLLDGISAPRA
jgi:CheY-like chemotaxis protein